jgi:serine/threonine-protein kinase HipA
MVTAEVRYNNQHVGTVAWDDRRSLGSFEFTSQFVAKGIDLSPITMPLNDLKRGERIFSFPALDRNTFYGLPGLLADGLPDKFGNTLIEAWQKRTGHAHLNPVERLCYVGKRAMGALEFDPASGAIKGGADPIDLGELVDLANQIMSEKEGMKADFNKEPKDAMLEIIKVGTSAGGARAKAVIAYNESTREVRSGQVEAPPGFTHWLLKFDGVESGALGDAKGFGRIELAYHKMAVAAGIEMSECRLLEENGRAHFMTRRFDRADSGAKTHVQTLCGLAHFDFNKQSTYSYEQVFEIMRSLGLPYKDAEQLFRRMTFNVLGRNLDDHTKNISFLMNDAGAWQLSPAYDISYAYNPSGWTFQHQLSVNGKYKNITEDDILALAKAMNIKRPNEVMAEIKAALKRWEQFAEDAHVPEKETLKIKSDLLIS